MSKKLRIAFHQPASPIVGFITKFGGQPDWLSAPQWPTSRETGNPMRFLCQIKLMKDLFPNTKADMAYLFMTDEGDERFVDGTYEPDGGENAVILQPGHTTIPTKDLKTGPTLYRMVEKPGYKLLQPEECQFSVTLSDDADSEASEADSAENKIGGKPGFLQGEEFPFSGVCRLLLQLDSCSAPFYLNFGDAGVGYAFLNESGDQAKFL